MSKSERFAVNAILLTPKTDVASFVGAATCLSIVAATLEVGVASRFATAGRGFDIGGFDATSGLDAGLTTGFTIC
jgi:hypothetical protein